MPVVHRWEIDEDDDTTSSFDLETFNETPKTKNVLRTATTRSKPVLILAKQSSNTGRSRFNSTRL